jgi:hypothetical protein
MALLSNSHLFETGFIYPLMNAILFFLTSLKFEILDKVWIKGQVKESTL